MLEALKGLNIADPMFIIPLVIGLLVFLLVIKLVKKMVKLAILAAVVILAIIVYVNLPSFKVEGSTAVLKVKGQEYRLDAGDMKITSENKDDAVKVFLVSGSTKIELPFSKEYAEKFILDRLKKD